MIARILNLLLFPVAFILILFTYLIYPIISYILGRGFAYFLEDFIDDILEIALEKGSLTTIQALFNLIIFNKKLK